jgi:DNA invertase Pin-like site-specific DNA recombinase
VKRVLCYLRQSDSDGAGERSLSLESQSSVLRADAERFGWRIVGELRDADLRGHDDSRPGLQELYARCRAGDVDVVAFWSLSRLARSVRLTENIVHELDRLGVELHSNQESWVSIPMMRQVMASFAEQQTRDIRAHVRRALRTKQQSGIHHGNIPFGYLRNEPNKPLFVHPGNAEIIAGIFAMRASGIGPAEIARDLTRRGIPTPSGLGAWRVGTVSRILRCATYRGAVKAGDGFIEGAHPAIVEPDLWHAAQQRHQRRSPRQKLIRSWLEGHIVHGCGLPMYLIQSHAGRQPYFRCRAGAAGILATTQRICPVQPRRIVLAIVEDAAWQAVTDALTGILSPRRVLAEATRRYRQDAPGSVAARQEALQRKSRAVDRRSRAEGLYLSGARDRAWFDVEDAQLAAELAEADRLLIQLPAEPDESAIVARWEALTALRGELDRIGLENRGVVLHELGEIVVGHPEGHGVRLRLRDGYAEFVCG